MLNASQFPARVSVVDAPRDAPTAPPVLAASVPTVHGEQVGLVVDQATARELIKELEDAVRTAERMYRARG